ncbi:MAG: ATP-binding protein [Micromonosporaceae bacterium]
MFGVRVRAHRQRLGLTQEELARATGLSARNIRNIEAGRISNPRPGTVRLLADAYALSGADRDAFLDAGRSGAEPSPAAATLQGHATPAQLPGDVAGFTGRTDHLRRLDQLLHVEDGSPTVVISAIGGTAGVGKTTLAVHWAHRAAKHFPDGQLYVNLRGFDPSGAAMSPSEAVRGFLDALGVPPQRIPSDLAAQTALYRSLLAGKRVLIVLDNARDAAQARPLLPGAAGCLVLVTSRNRLTSLVAHHGAHPLALDLLSREEAHDFLVRRLGADRVTAAPDAVDEIVVRCARLPLALAIVAAHAMMRPARPLATFAAELREAGLAAFTGDDLVVNPRAVFSWSYQALSEEAARLFRLLGLHPGPEISTVVAANLAGHQLPQVRRLLDELVGAHLVTEPVPGRYSFHDLLRAYAVELAATHDDRHAAALRMYDHYLATSHTAAVLTLPQRVPIVIETPHLVVPSRLASDDAALEWLETEYAALLRVVRQAADTGFDTHAWQLGWSLRGIWGRRGLWADASEIQSLCLEAAERLADGHAQALIHVGLAWSHVHLGHLDTAEEHQRQALKFFHQIGDPAAEAQAHRGLAHCLVRRGRTTEALRHVELAVELFRAAGRSRGLDGALNAMGWYHALLGNYSQALGWCQQALKLCEQTGDRDEQADTWDSLGYIHHQLGEWRRAVTCFERSLELREPDGERYLKAQTFERLGDTHFASGVHGAAHDAWQAAVRLFDELEHGDAEAVREKLETAARPAPSS